MNKPIPERALTVEEADIGLDRDVFLRSLLRELAGTLESVVGLEEAAGYISVVGGCNRRATGHVISQGAGRGQTFQGSGA